MGTDIEEIANELLAIEYTIEALWNGHETVCIAGTTDLELACETVAHTLEVEYSVESIITKGLSNIWDFIVSIYTSIKTLIVRLFKWMGGFFTDNEKADKKADKKTSAETKKASETSESANAAMHVTRATYEDLVDKAAKGDRYAAKVVDDINKGRVRIVDPDPVAITLIDYLVRDTGLLTSDKSLLSAYGDKVYAKLSIIAEQLRDFDKYMVGYRLALGTFNDNLFDAIEQALPYTMASSQYHDEVWRLLGIDGKAHAAMVDLISRADTFDIKKFVSTQTVFIGSKGISWDNTSVALPDDKSTFTPPPHMDNYGKGYLGWKVTMQPEYLKQTTIQSTSTVRSTRSTVKKMTAAYNEVKPLIESMLGDDSSSDALSWSAGGRWSKRKILAGTDTTISGKLAGKLWNIASKSASQVSKTELSIITATAKEVSSLTMSLSRIMKLANQEKNEVLKDLQGFNKMLKKAARA